MVRGRRLLLGALGVAGALSLVALAVLGTRVGQTWLVRRALANVPGTNATVEWARLGWGHAAVGNLVWRQGPLELKVPAAEAEFSVGAMLASGGLSFESVRISAAELVVAEPMKPVLPTVGVFLEAISRGFGTWDLPFPLELEKIELAGSVRAPGLPTAAKLSVKGGGIGLGREARLELVCQAETGEAEVAKIDAVGTVTLRLRSARRPDLLTFDGEVRAEGARWPQPVKVALAVSAHDHGAYQDYRGTCWTDERPLVAWGARMTDALPGAPARMSGTWMLDVRPGDLAPLLPGSPWAALTVRSEGRFAADEPFAGFDLEGELKASCPQPRLIWPQWPKDLPARVEGRFQLRQSSDLSQVKALAVTLQAEEAHATLAIERDFEVRWPGGMDMIFPPGERLGTVEVRHWPWLLVPADLDPSGGLPVGALSGRIAFWPRARGWSLRSEGELTTEPRTLILADTECFRDLRTKAEVSLQWLAEGWQLEASRFSLIGPEGEFAQGEFKSGRLSQADQPLKLAGKLKVDLGLAGKSCVWPGLAVRSGEVTADLAASLGVVRGWRAQIESRGVRVLEGRTELMVPALKIDARLESDAAGRVAFDLPVAIGEGESGRDLRVAGSVRSSGKGDKWEASISGQFLRAEDIAVLAAWGGFTEGRLGRLLGEDGRVGLRFGRVALNGRAEVQGLEADLVVRQAVGALTARAGWSQGGQVSLRAELRPRPGAVQVVGQCSGLQMGTTELWRMVVPSGATPLEGVCDGALDFEGTLTSPLAARATLELVSRGGVFHGLPVSFVRVAESTNRLTSWLASASLAFNALTGRSTEAEIAGRSQAVAELVRGLNPVNCDQFTVKAERLVAGEWRVRDLALIAPELRLLGEGSLGAGDAGAGALSLTLQLRARGRTAELMQYLGVLQEQRDSLGYAGCALPVRLAGTVARPDATELNQRLAALSVEKPGRVDKALEFLGRWRSPGPEGAVKP